MSPAIHIKSRSWLRSSSTHEPSDPPLRVIFLFFRMRRATRRHRNCVTHSVKHSFATNNTSGRLPGALREPAPLQRWYYARAASTRPCASTRPSGNSLNLASRTDRSLTRGRLPPSLVGATLVRPPFGRRAFAPRPPAASRYPNTNGTSFWHWRLSRRP